MSNRKSSCDECGRMICICGGVESKPCTEKFVTFDVIQGVFGIVVSVNDTRVAGPKPWGGGRLLASLEVRLVDLLEAIGVKPRELPKTKMRKDYAKGLCIPTGVQPYEGWVRTVIENAASAAYHDGQRNERERAARIVKKHEVRVNGTNYSFTADCVDEIKDPTRGANSRRERLKR